MSGSSAPAPQTWIFLRGLVRERGHWAGFLERFRAEFPERRVLALDIPGAGGRFRERSPTSVPGMVEAMRAEALPHLGKGENFLFALSLGAMVGVQWMHSYPEDFKGAVLVNSSLRGLSPLHHRLRPENYGRILKLLASAGLYEREKTILEMTSNRVDSVARLAHEWTRIQEARPVSRVNALRQLLAAARFSPPREKPRARVLVLGGLGDRLVNPLCGRRIAEHWGVSYAAHPSAGHDLTLDEPEWVLEWLRDFS
jgi:pimeloyl-ACP methyl ester carboxylesterase